MTHQNPSYNDFQIVKEILLNVKKLINNETDITWSRYSNVSKLLEDLNNDIAKIENCYFDTLHRLNGEFAPTSTYNEIAFSSGWAQEYIDNAAQFDKIYEKIINNG